MHEIEQDLFVNDADDLVIRTMTMMMELRKDYPTYM